MSLLLKDNADKKPPGHYNPVDLGGLKFEVKAIRFPISRAPRKTNINEEAE